MSIQTTMRWHDDDDEGKQEQYGIRIDMLRWNKEEREVKTVQSKMFC